MYILVQRVRSGRRRRSLAVGPVLSLNRNLTGEWRHLQDDGAGLDLGP